MEREDRTYQLYKKVMDDISTIASEEIDKIKRDPWKAKEVVGIYVVTPITPERDITFKFVEIHDDNVSKDTKYVNIDSKQNCQKIGLPSEMIKVGCTNVSAIDLEELLNGKILYDRDKVLVPLKKYLESEGRYNSNNDDKVSYSLIFNDIKYQSPMQFQKRKSSHLKLFR